MAAEVWVVRSGVVPYDEARDLQRSLEQARYDDRVPDLLLLLEHPPTYTKGRRASAEELPMGEDWYRMQGIEVCDTDRGGRVTYHGPGQLVGYPIVDLEGQDGAPLDVGEYIRRLERVIVGALGDWGVEAGLLDGMTGVWVGDRKIGAIGVHVNRAITTHGFAINVNNDLQPFEWIVPCGIEALKVTSLARELGAEQDLGAFADTVAECFGDVCARTPVEVARERVAELAGAAPSGFAPSVP
jgi:lipoyl(octanoyl) transferase